MKSAHTARIKLWGNPMFIRTSVAASCLALAACGSSSEPTPEELAFVERFAAYCGQADPAPYGTRACNAYIVRSDETGGCVVLLAGVHQYGYVFIAARDDFGNMNAGATLHAWYAPERIERIVGPQDEDYLEVHQRYLNQVVRERPEAEDAATSRQCQSAP